MPSEIRSGNAMPKGGITRSGKRSVKLLLIAGWDTVEAFPHGQDGGGSFQDRGLMAGDLKM